MADKIRVTVWNENVHEQKHDKVKELYPKGMHAVIAEALGAESDLAVRTAVLHEKVGSPVRADYAGETITRWRWLIYPWAVVEDVGGFLREMTPPPQDVEQATAWLRETYGLDPPRDQVQRLRQERRLDGTQPLSYQVSASCPIDQDPHQRPR